MRLQSLTEPVTGAGALIVICGPTATGKSGLALAIAQRLEAQKIHSIILSADSRQVYRGFDIGTAKPSWEEQAQIRHHLIDICEPTDTLTLGDFQQQAQALIAQAQVQNQAVRHQSNSCQQNSRQQNGHLQNSHLQNRYQMQSEPTLPLLVGGTGLYIKSVVRGMKIPRVPPQPQLRSQLKSLGQRHNYGLLQAVDAIAATKIHPNDSVRTQRALEVFYVTGATISSQQGENPPDYPILQIGLDCLEETAAQPGQNRQPGRKQEPMSDRLSQRIYRRTRQMVEQGFVEEVQRLCDRYGQELPLLNTLGYAEIRQHLGGEIDLETAIHLTALHTRQFAKRQRTWFRAIPEIEWFDSDAPELVEKVWERIQRF